MSNKIPEKRRPLKVKQLAFIAEYVKDFNGSRAVLAAGYKDKNPSAAASELLKNPLIKEEIDKVRQQVLSKAPMTLENAVNVVRSDIEFAKENKGVNSIPRLRELELRLLGFLDNSITVNVNAVPDLSLVIAEARARVSTIRDDSKVLDAEYSAIDTPETEK